MTCILYLWSDANRLKLTKQLHDAEMAVQAAQTGLDQMLQKEDQRLKKRGRHQRRRNAKKLGTAQTAQDDAQEKLTNFINAREEMALQGSLDPCIQPTFIVIVCTRTGPRTDRSVH
jgi:hypothetical protein